MVGLGQLLKLVRKLQPGCVNNRLGLTEGMPMVATLGKRLNRVRYKERNITKAEPGKPVKLFRAHGILQG